VSDAVRAGPLRREDGDFNQFVAEVEPRLRRALVAALGVDRGREAVAEALAFAWEHWPRVRGMDNAAGYLYRVGRSRSRRRRLVVPFRWGTSSEKVSNVEPELVQAMNRLPEKQRVSVLLVHGYGWSHREAAEFLEVSPSTIASHVARGLDSLRKRLGDVDA
jgi:DNA-directed RNA polymerase specialized sigma24 family protein